MAPLLRTVYLLLHELILMCCKIFGLLLTCIYFAEYWNIVTLTVGIDIGALRVVF